MPEPTPPKPKTPWTIPLAAGPVAPWLDRTLAVGTVAAAATSVAVLLPLEPDGKGYDTHTQLGLDPCGWPVAYGIPCPTCGCTTAATHLVHGAVVDAFVTQPFGAALALFGLLLGLHALVCLVLGRSFVDLIVRVSFGRWLLGAVALFLLAWGYKYLTF